MKLIDLAIVVDEGFLGRGGGCWWGFYVARIHTQRLRASLPISLPQFTFEPLVPAFKPGAFRPYGKNLVILVLSPALVILRTNDRNSVR